MQRIINQLGKYALFCFLFLVVGLVLVLAPIQKAAAQEIVSKGLTLSPLRTEMTIDPGISVDGSLTLTNSTGNSIEVDLNAEEFSVINQQYDYAFKPVSDVTKWVSFKSNKVSLLANETITLPFTVSVPLSTEPGGKYISLFASTNSDSAVNGANLRQRIASLLYVTINGAVTRNGNLISLISPWFVTDNSGNWSMAMQNTGTTHFSSRYNIVVRQLFNNKEVSSVSEEALILPGTIRALSGNLPPLKIPGIYKVVSTIGLGDKPSAVETRWLIFVPMWPLVIIIMLLFLLFLAVAKHLNLKHKKTTS